MRKQPRWASFSLVELLVVVAVIAMLATVSIPAIGSMATSRGVTQAGFDVTQALDLARTEALARQTYVWAAFQTVTNNGVRYLQVGLVYSLDGSTNTTSTNLKPVAIPYLIRQVGLGTASNLDSKINQSLSAKFPGAMLSDIATNSGVGFKIGRANFDQNRSVTFTPRGEAMLAPSPSVSDGFDRLVGVIDLHDSDERLTAWDGARVERSDVSADAEHGHVADRYTS